MISKPTIPRWARTTGLALFLGYQAVSTPAMFSGCPITEREAYVQDAGSLPSQQDIETLVLKFHCAAQPCSDSYNITIQPTDTIYENGVRHDYLKATLSHSGQPNVEYRVEVVNKAPVGITPSR